MASVRVYIDGFNLYHAIDKLGDHALKWINLRKMGETLLRGGEVLDEVHFFTAVWTFEGKKQLRHKNYIAAQQACGVVVHEGKFSKPNKWCEKSQAYCAFREEKQTDVAISLKMATDAIAGKTDRLILITADSDQIPTAKLIAQMPGVKISLAYPPGRAQEARDLGSVIKDRRELKVGRLLTCRLPRNVLVGDKVVATMPAIYRHP